MEFNLENRIWWSYIGQDLQKLLESSVFLIGVARSWGGDMPNGKEAFHDYSFCVFPAAKAYEGYLKKIFLELGFITKEDYFGKRFRIGKALNPYLENKYRAEESVYDKLVDYCGGKELADTLWEAWKSARNMVFHWYPDEKNAITLKEAEERIVQVLVAMDKTSVECKIKM